MALKFSIESTDVVYRDPQATRSRLLRGIAQARGPLWLDGAPQPDADDLQRNCRAVDTLFPGPCRFDPDYEIADMDGRIRPR